MADPEWSKSPQHQSRHVDTQDMIRQLLNLLFVPTCAACDECTDDAHSLCAPCAASLYELGTACPRCGQPQSGPHAQVCRPCRRRPPPYTATYAGYRYGGELAHALRRLKYHRRRDIARTLAPLLAPVLRRAAAHADIALPIPLHWRRAFARGFNQSALLLVHASRDLSIPIALDIMRRIRDTRAQSSLPLSERQANVRNAFAIYKRHRAKIRGQRILLLDDVMTSGATMAAAARAARTAGAHSVIAVALARTES